MAWSWVEAGEGAGGAASRQPGRVAAAVAVTAPIAARAWRRAGRAGGAPFTAGGGPGGGGGRRRTAAGAGRWEGLTGAASSPAGWVGRGGRGHKPEEGNQG